MAEGILIIGAGFSGAVLARELADAWDDEILVIEGRDHVGGNCHTERDAATGIMVHRHGPHIFNTNSREVWDYVNRFGRFRSYVSRVKACTTRGVFSLPITLHTINQFFGKAMGPAEAEAFIGSIVEPAPAGPRNFEEAALATIGRELYDTFIHGYTKKQWGCEPRELPAAVFQRLPVRFSYDDNYYDSLFQGIPEDGYTAVVARILQHPRIHLELGRRFDPGEMSSPRARFRHVFYTGPLDEFFGHRFGRLSYRTVAFERIEALGDFQGCAVLNFPGLEVPYTRVHEHKHFTPWESHEKTVAFREYSHETGPGDTPYYPKRLARDKELLLRYRDLARETPGVSFLGRLATYRYLDMERVIAEALDFARMSVACLGSGQRLPAFPNPD